MTGCYRPDVEALIGPGATERLSAAPACSWSRCACSIPARGQFRHLRPGEARELAYQLLAAAEYADNLTDRHQAG